MSKELLLCYIEISVKIAEKDRRKYFIVKSEYIL